MNLFFLFLPKMALYCLFSLSQNMNLFVPKLALYYQSAKITILYRNLVWRLLPYAKLESFKNNLPLCLL